MARPARIEQPMTPAEYLAFEERAKIRYEFVDGYVYAMSGTTLRHNRVLLNVARHLLAAADGGPCKVFVNDLKVRVGETRFYYPDVGVVCGPTDDDALVISDPCLIVEVVSPSTRTTDHREKLTAYQRIPALGTYLIVETDRREVHRHWRDADGRWRYDIVGPGGGGDVAVPCPEAVLTLDQIYASVTLRPRVRRVKEAAPA